MEGAAWLAEFAKKIASSAPLGLRAMLSSAHRALAEGETAPYAALAPEFGRIRMPVYHGR
jgi:hypothetical protein